MSQPIKTTTVICPECQHRYEDWYRTVGFGDHFDDEYLDKCSSAVCPKCQYKVYFETYSIICRNEPQQS